MAEANSEYGSQPRPTENTLGARGCIDIVRDMTSPRAEDRLAAAGTIDTWLTYGQMMSDYERSLLSVISAWTVLIESDTPGVREALLNILSEFVAGMHLTADTIYLVLTSIPIEDRHISEIGHFESIEEMYSLMREARGRETLNMGPLDQARAMVRQIVTLLNGVTSTSHEQRLSSLKTINAWVDRFDESQAAVIAGILVWAIRIEDNRQEVRPELFSTLSVMIGRHEVPIAVTREVSSISNIEQLSPLELEIFSRIRSIVEE